MTLSSSWSFHVWHIPYSRLREARKKKKMASFYMHFNIKNATVIVCTSKEMTAASRYMYSPQFRIWILGWASNLKWNIFWSVGFLEYYILCSVKLYPIFDGSVHNFGKRYGKKVKVQIWSVVKVVKFRNSEKATKFSQNLSIN